MINLQIEQKDSKGKGRVFEATLLGYITSNWLWPQAGDNERPILAVIAATEAQGRPFMANLQTGAKALSGGSKHSKSTFEFLRSSRYLYATQRFEGMSVTTVYLPELWDINPGMVDPKEIKFVCGPSVEWSETHRTRLPCDAMVDHALKTRTKGGEALTREKLHALCPVASLFCSYLDGRTRAPIIPDPCFHLQLLLACLDANLAVQAEESDGPSSYGRWSTAKNDLKIVGRETIGLDVVVGFQSEHEPFNEVLSNSTDRYFTVKG